MRLLTIVLVLALAAQQVVRRPIVVSGACASSKPANPAVLCSTGALLTNLVAAYAVTEGSGTNLNDSSTNNNDGTLVNTPTWTTGPLGTELDLLAASNQHVSLGNPAALQITGSITIAVSYKLDSTPVNMMLVAKDKDSGGRAYVLDIDNSGVEAVSGVRFYINGGESAGEIAFEGRDAVSGDDRIAVAVYDAAAQTIKIYIDGVLEATETGSPASIDSATANVLIGRREYTGFEGNLDGRIRFVYIWNTPLDAAAVASLSSNPWQIFAP